ncbi:MAG: cobalamin biosynthesis protein P47K [Lachnospiraceae bacterium]|nr:cobalamin biosynthesis protein P47K [Lachnospiraceae bacterium]
MNIIILGGFLGAGKTSFLLQLTEFLSQRTARIVILENEIGKISIDDQSLQNTRLTVRSIFANCICCSGTAELTSNVRQIRREYNPDWLLIEATGLALPHAVRTTLLEAGEKGSVRTLTLVDANRYRRLKKAMPALIDGQLEGCDAVALNKVDLVGDTEARAIQTELELQTGVTVFAVSAGKPMTDTEIAQLAGVSI